jgi:alanine racemase
MPIIQLNKRNFFHNLDKIVAKTVEVSKVALVLKDNAYGHGLLEIAKLASEYGISKAVVRSNAEAEQIEEFFEYILVLADFPQNLSQKIRYTINDISMISKFPKGTLVELKVNTAMNRNGVNMQEINASIEKIKLHGLKLEAIFTHHSCADELNGNYELQKSNFEDIKKRAPHGLRFHSCNSAALFREENFSEDMVRVGIAAYGCLELPKEFNLPKLQPILSLYAQKISQRELDVGESVGYGATFIARSKLHVSNYDFGYGDGFLRSCSKEYETPQKIKLAGRISMDNSSFLSDVEKLLIFDDARVVAKFAQTISYEVLTSLKSYIKREIV